MRAMTQAILILALLNILTLLGGVGWLSATDRLSRERVEAAYALFKPTLEQEKAELEKQAAAQRQIEQEAAEQMRLTGVGGALQSSAERLVETQQRDALMLRRLERAKEDLESLQRNLLLAQQRTEQERKDLEARRLAFEQELEQRQQALDEEGFDRAVAMYDQLPSKQVKQMFLSLMEQGQVDQVVRYLEAMEPRKAAGALKEFKGPEDVSYAVMLTERLRTQGSELVKQLES